MKTLLVPTLAVALATASSASAQTLIQTFTASQDTFVRSDAPNSSFGTDTTLLVGGHSSVGPFNSFYKFENVDLTGIASISSVTLRLTSIAQAGSGTVNINLYQLSAANSDWKEGVSGTVPTGTSDTGATFNNKSGQGASAVTWAGGNTNANFVAGTDFVNTVLGNFSGAANTATGGQTFDFGNAALVSLLSASIGSTTTFNFVLRDQTGATNFLRIASSEHGTEAWRPQLIIEYTPIPEPSAFAALAGLGALGLAATRRRRRA